MGRGGLVTVAGGKLTGFRKMAESVLEAVEGATDLTLGPAPGPTALPARARPSPPCGPAAQGEQPLSRGRGASSRLYGEDSSAVLAQAPRRWRRAWR